MRIETLKKPSFILWTALAAGVIGDLLFFRRPVGISFPFFLSLLAIALIVIARREERQITWANTLLIVPMLFFAIMLAVRASGLLSFLNLAGSVLLLGLVCAGLIGDILYQKNLFEMASVLARAIFHTLIQPFSLLAKVLRPSSEDGSKANGMGRQVLVGVLITLPVLVVFSALLATADLIFQQGISALFANLRLDTLISHLLLIAFITFITAGGLTAALVMHRKPDHEEPSAPAPDERPPHKVLGMVESGILLFTVDALFLVFVIIQFAVLFGGEAYLERQGLTYSEYARRGFFELLAVSVIVLGLILLLEWVTRRDTSRQKALFMTGASLMIVMTVVMLASAHLRMSLYESAYGYTMMRLYPHIFMGWLAGLLMAVLVLILFNKPRYVAASLLVFCIGFVVTMNLINPDRLIARQNIARYERGEDLDTSYFYDLTIDALPEAASLYERMDDTAVKADLLDWMQYEYDALSWRRCGEAFFTWHASYARAYTIFDEIPELAEQTEACERY